MATPEFYQSVARALSLPPAAVARCLSDVATARTVAAYLPGTGPASIILALLQAGISAADTADLIRDV